MKTFRDELIMLTRFKVKSVKIIEDIKNKAREQAEQGCKKVYKVYKLKQENPSHFGNSDYLVDKNIIHNSEDLFIIKELEELGVDVDVISCNLNAFPEVGQEGYDAAYFLNIHWDRYV